MSAINRSKDDYIPNFSHVTEEGLIQSKYAIPYENNLKIFMCKGLRQPLRDVWKRLRFFI